MLTTSRKQELANTDVFREGIRDGIPIGLGYLAVSFSLGIAARNAGLTPFQGFLASFLTNASAGEYACFTLIAASANLIELLLVTLIANGRYILMSCSLSQKFSEETPFYHRFFVGYYITDELFSIAIARKGALNPYYTYGAVLLAAPGWAFGTYLGVIAGNLLPFRIVSALSVALYGMFLAVIIPPARKDKIIAVLVIVSFLLSYIAAYSQIFAGISSGTKTIILTLLISSVAAIIKPVREKTVEE